MESNNINSKFFKIDYTKRKRKHYEVMQSEEEKQLPQFIIKRRKIISSLNPLMICSTNIFSMISPLMIRNSFPVNYKFENYFEKDEREIIESLIEANKPPEEVINFLIILKKYNSVYCRK